MTITNTPKPSSGTQIDAARVVEYETWDTNTSTWDTETRTWDSMQSSMENVSLPSVNLTNSFSSFPSTALRNDFTGAVGFRFVLTSDVYLYQVGRLYVAGNSQNHKINIWISTDTVTPIATATILAATTSDSSNYKYVSFSSHVQLTAGNTYHVTCNNTSGGDTFKDLWSAAGTINSPFGSVASSFALSQDVFPTFGGVANSMYDTIAFKFGLSNYDTQMINTLKPS